jgi:hypothetical protein
MKILQCGHLQSPFAATTFTAQPLSKASFLLDMVFYNIVQGWMLYIIGDENKGRDTSEQ